MEIKRNKFFIFNQEALDKYTRKTRKAVSVSLLALAVLACAGSHPESVNSIKEQADTSASGKSSAYGRLIKVAPDKLENLPEGLVDLGEQPPFSPSIKQEMVSLISDSGEESISFNFTNAPIENVAEIILGERLGYNYVIDATIKKTLNFRSSRPIPAEKIFSVLETTLSSIDLIIEKREDVYFILPRTKAKSSSHATHGHIEPSNDDNGFGTQFFPLKFANANELSEVLSPFLSNPKTQLFVHQAENMVVVTGSGQERRLITQIVNMFDIDLLSNMSFALLPVTTADINSLIRELDVIFQQSRLKDENKSIVFMPVQRLNSLLIVANSQTTLKQASTWITRLDRGDIGDKPKLYVYYLKHANATEVVSILHALYGDTKNTAASPTIQAESENNITSDDVRAQSAQDKIINHTASNNALPKNMKYIPDTKNNALYLLIPQSTFNEIETVLNHLDKAPRQILIEAIIAEVKLDDRLKYGVQWFLNSDSGKNTFSLLANTASPQPSLNGFSYVLNKADVRAVITALDSVTDVNILSSPQLLVMDSETAILQVGDQVPITKQSRINTNSQDTSSIINTVELKDTGIILKVSPRINGEKSVTIEITQEVSNVIETTSSGIDSPTIQQRKISSKVLVESGQSILLGGLIRNSQQDTRTGIPGLMNIPLIGNLFSGREVKTNRTELLIMLSPKIIENTADIKRAVSALAKHLKGIKGMVKTYEMEDKLPIN